MYTCTWSILILLYSSPLFSSSTLCQPTEQTISRSVNQSVRQTIHIRPSRPQRKEKCMYNQVYQLKLRGPGRSPKETIIRKRDIRKFFLFNAQRERKNKGTRLMKKVDRGMRVGPRKKSRNMKMEEAGREVQWLNAWKWRRGREQGRRSVTGFRFLGTRRIRLSPCERHYSETWCDAKGCVWSGVRSAMWQMPGKQGGRIADYYHTNSVRIIGIRVAMLHEVMTERVRKTNVWTGLCQVISKYPSWCTTAENSRKKEAGRCVMALGKLVRLKDEVGGLGNTNH